MTAFFICTGRGISDPFLFHIATSSFVLSHPKAYLSIYNRKIHSGKGKDLFAQQALQRAISHPDFDKDKKHCYGPADKKEVFHNVGDLGRLLFS